VPWSRSIRLRLALTLALVVSAVVVGFAALAAQMTLGSARDQEREIAIAQLQAATAAYRFSGSVSSNASTGVNALPPQLKSVLTPGTMVTWDDGTQLWAASKLDDGTLLSTRIPNAPIQHRWQQLRDRMLGLALAAVAVALVAGWLIAVGVTRRLRATADVAGSISRGDLSQRADATGRDEVAVLAVALNSMTEELLARIEQEQAMTADAAHELRTPLTALVTATELLDPGPAADRVRRNTRRLRSLIEDVLRLAHLEAGLPSDPTARVDLGSFVRTMIGDEPERADCEVSVAESTMVVLNPDGARRAIGNLVRNALRHGAGPVSLRVEGSVLTIADHGRGYPAELLREGPRRFHPLGDTGRTGLGLTIVVRELDGMGAKLTLSNSASGSLSTIEFRT
jgi:signal transduction histidine kinase